MEPRLKTSIWVDAFLRQASVMGHFGAVVQKGHDDAGQVFILFHRQDRGIDVLAPPPGPAFDDLGQRRFEQAMAGQAWPVVKEWLDRRRRLDADFWVVEIDARDGFAGLSLENA